MIWILWFSKLTKWTSDGKLILASTRNIMNYTVNIVIYLCILHRQMKCKKLKLIKKNLEILIILNLFNHWKMPKSIWKSIRMLSLFRMIWSLKHMILEILWDLIILVILEIKVVAVLATPNLMFKFLKVGLNSSMVKIHPSSRHKCWWPATIWTKVVMEDGLIITHILHKMDIW